MNYQVLVESMDSERAHIGLYANQDVSSLLSIMIFVHMMHGMGVEMVIKVSEIIYLLEMVSKVLHSWSPSCH